MTEQTKTQIGGTHYMKMRIQPIEYIMNNNLSFAAGNVIKYVSRFDAKGGVEDLRKAKDYIERMIDAEEKRLREPEGAPLTWNISGYSDAVRDAVIQINGGDK